MYTVTHIPSSTLSPIYWVVFLNDSKARTPTVDIFHRGASDREQFITIILWSLQKLFITPLLYLSSTSSDEQIQCIQNPVLYPGWTSHQLIDSVLNPFIKSDWGALTLLISNFCIILISLSHETFFTHTPSPARAV